MKTMVLYCHLIHYNLPHWKMLPLLGTEEMVPCWVFLCMLNRRRISIWGTLWHFSSPDCHTENLHDISECSTFSHLIPRLMSPTPCYKHTHTHTQTTETQTCTQINRYTDTETHRGTHTQTHRHTKAHRHTNRHSHTKMPDPSPIQNRTERTILQR